MEKFRGTQTVGACQSANCSLDFDIKPTNAITGIRRGRFSEIFMVVHNTVLMQQKAVQQIDVYMFVKHCFLLDTY